MVKSKKSVNAATTSVVATTSVIPTSPYAPESTDKSVLSSAPNLTTATTSVAAPGQHPPSCLND